MCAGDAPQPGAGTGAGNPPPSAHEWISAALADKLRKQVDLIMLRMESPDERVLQNTANELERLGIKAIPLVGRYVNHHNPAAAMVVRKTLVKMLGEVPPLSKRDITLETASELKLSATLVGNKPRPGEVVTLWITLGNYSTHEVRVIESGWSLRLKPIEGANEAPADGMVDPEERKLHDYVVLKPGQTAGFLMDAETPEDTKEITEAWLEMPLSESARADAKAATFTTREELASGPIEMGYAEEPPAPPTETVDLCNFILKGAAAAGTQREAAKSLDAWRAAIRLGFRRATEADRLKIFQFLCAHPDPLLEDDLVDFVGRFGPRLTPEDEILKGIDAFKKGLPEERRPVFINRLCFAVIHDWRTCVKFVNRVDTCRTPGDFTAAFSVFKALYDRGNHRAQILDWFAWNYYFADDPKIRDPQKAQAYADEAEKVAPNNILTTVFLKGIQNDQPGLNRLLRLMPNTDSYNYVAGVILVRAPRGHLLQDFASKSIDAALQQVKPDAADYSDYLDTQAGCLAASGDYLKALEVQESSYAKRDKTDYRDLEFEVAQIVQYVALAHAYKSEYPVHVLRPAVLTSATARDALLDRLKTEKDDAIRLEIVRILKANYPHDALVTRTLK